MAGAGVVELLVIAGVVELLVIAGVVMLLVSSGEVALLVSGIVPGAGVVELLVRGMVLDVGACVDVATLALVLVVCVAPCGWSGREKQFSV